MLGVEHRFFAFLFELSCLLFDLAVSLRPGLVKLLALSNFQARRRIVIRVSPALDQEFSHCTLENMSSELLSRSNTLLLQVSRTHGCSTTIFLLLLFYARR